MQIVFTHSFIIGSEMEFKLWIFSKFHSTSPKFNLTGAIRCQNKGSDYLLLTESDPRWARMSLRASVSSSLLSP